MTSNDPTTQNTGKSLDYKALCEKGSTYGQWDKGEHGQAYDTNFEAAFLSRSDLDFLEGIDREIHILALCEPWCGDVIRQLPILARMCVINPKLQLSILNRDEHPEVMERFLTAGAQSIPVFVFFNDEWVEVGNWKARPMVCRQVLSRAKAAGQLAEGKEAISEIMDTTKNRLTVEEIKILLDRALSEPGRWQNFCDDAMERLTPMATEETVNPKTYERVLDVYHCQDYVEVFLIQDALKEAKLHFFMQMFQDRVWDGLFQKDKGVAVVQVLEEDVDKALDVIENTLFPDEIEDSEEAEEEAAETAEETG